MTARLCAKSAQLEGPSAEMREYRGEHEASRRSSFLGKLHSPARSQVVERGLETTKLPWDLPRSKVQAYCGWMAWVRAQNDGQKSS